jgi:hypothetical protein
VFPGSRASPVVGFRFVILIPVPVAGGPSWTDILTAIGTVGAVIAAVGIALWAEWRSGRRLAAEQARSDRQLEEERARSRAEIEEERRIGREREQLAEAYAVQVVLGERTGGERDDVYDEPLSEDVKVLAVMVVNRGSFTITEVEAKFSYDGRSWVNHAGYQRLSGFGNVSERLRHRWRPSSELAMYGVLAPWDAGIRFESDEVHVQNLKNPYPLVRWTDRWGTRWEHRRGELGQVGADEQWKP